MQFTADETNSEVTNVFIQGEAVDHAITFVLVNGNISSRTVTTAGVNWSPPVWGVVKAAGVDQRTPNLSGILQEIVNRSGWASGNSMVIIITGSGERTAESFNGSSGEAPLLHIEFVIPVAILMIDAT